jgi:predicted Zn-dependent peptidase
VTVRPIPPVSLELPGQAPRLVERTLSTGLRVQAVRRPSVPLVSLRLWIPWTSRDERSAAAGELMAGSMLLGTKGRGAEELSAALEGLGADLGADLDPDRVAVDGSVLAENLPRLLELVAEILTSAAYREDDLGGERDRLLQKLSIARSRPGVVAREALLHRLYGDHPYGSELVSEADVAPLGSTEVRSLHRRAVRPAGAILTLVGDLSPARAIRWVEDILGGWTGGHAPRVPSLPKVAPGPVVLVERPGAAQTNIRLAGPAVPRTDERFAALDLASTAFAGYMTARLDRNIRETRGYTYGARSAIEHRTAGSRFVLSADVGTEVTGPALREIGYELARLVTEPLEAQELDAARHYAIGLLALSTASQAGLASFLSRLAARGLGPSYLRSYPKQLAALRAEDVLAAARTFLAPSRLVTVLVGDGARIRADLEALGAVEG